MKRYIYLLVCICLVHLSNEGFGQKAYLCLTNVQQGKALLFEQGDYVYIAYNGYLGQPEGLAGYIISIDTAGLVLGKTMMHKTEKKRIARADISGLRRLSAGIELAKACAVLAASLGAYSLAWNAGAGRWASLTASVASALSVQAGANAIFPSKRAKYLLADGWTVSILVI